MGRSHFADYMKNDRNGYQAFSDSLWNSFVSVTHTVGLGKFFSFTPAEIDGLDPDKIGRELGKVYNQANSDTNNPL